MDSRSAPSTSIGTRVRSAASRKVSSARPVKFSYAGSSTKLSSTIPRRMPSATASIGMPAVSRPCRMRVRRTSASARSPSFSTRMPSRHSRSTKSSLTPARAATSPRPKVGWLAVRARESSGIRSNYLPQPAGLDLVDQPVDRHVEQDRLLLEDLDLLPDYRVEIAETTEGHLGLEPGGLGDAAPQCIIIRAVEPAPRVRDHDDLPRAEELLADDERADRVLGCEPAGVSDDVGLADAEPERVLDIDPRVHARQDREARQRRGREPGPVEGLDEALVLFEDPLELALERVRVARHLAPSRLRRRRTRRSTRHRPGSGRSSRRS